tara:strand:+ start:247 stop:540 length:294 start_codon:yes stop_codon:yes gene_type:complete
MSIETADLFLRQQVELYKIFLQKNTAYGNSYQQFGAVGVIMRMGDKLMRLKTITQSSVSIDMGDESLRDTLKDLSNYCVLALLELDRLEEEQRDIHN